MPGGAFQWRPSAVIANSILVGKDNIDVLQAYRRTRKPIEPLRQFQCEVEQTGMNRPLGDSQM